MSTISAIMLAQIKENKKKEEQNGENRLYARRNRTVASMPVSPLFSNWRNAGNGC